MWTAGEFCFPGGITPSLLLPLFPPFLLECACEARSEQRVATRRWQAALFSEKKIPFYLVEHIVIASLYTQSLLINSSHHGREVRRPEFSQRGVRSLEKWSTARTSELCLQGLASTARASLPCFKVDSMLAWVVSPCPIYYRMALVSCLLHRDVTYEEEVGEWGWASVKLRCCVESQLSFFNTWQCEMRGSKTGHRMKA